MHPQGSPIERVLIGDPTLSRHSYHHRLRARSRSLGKIITIVMECHCGNDEHPCNEMRGMQEFVMYLFVSDITFSTISYF